MAGVMVDFGPPITHLPPPAVGTSPDAAIHDFKGSCRRSVRITVWGGAYPDGRPPDHSYTHYSVHLAKTAGGHESRWECQPHNA